jgi:hypothetical protein
VVCRIRKRDVPGLCVRIRINCNGTDAEPLCRLDDAASDFASIGDKKRIKHDFVLNAPRPDGLVAMRFCWKPWPLSQTFRAAVTAFQVDFIVDLK